MIPLNQSFPFYNPFLFQMHCDFYQQSWYYPQYSPLTIQEKQAETAICDKNVENLHESKTLTSSHPLPHEQSIEKPIKTKIRHTKPSSQTPPQNKKQTPNPNPEIQLPRNKNEVQKEGRNANSNLLRMFFRRISQRMDSQPELIRLIIRKNKLRIKLQAFREWLQINEIDHRNYVRLPDVRDLFVGGRNNREQAKIMRVLLKDFLQKEALCCYLTSKKVKRQAMPHNFHSMKNILKEIFLLPKSQ